ncbi:MAG: FG-GAP-like repeat-containing protein [Bacteroidota bacterium]
MRIIYALLVLFIFSHNKLNAQCCSFTYQQQVEPANSAATFGVGLGDFDGDGDLDAVAVSAYYGVDVYFNNGSGTYTLNAQYATGANHDFYGAVVADVDGDGDRDILIAPFYTSSDFTVLKNNGSGVFTVTSFSSNVGTYNFAMGDIDSDSDMDVFLPSGFGGDGKVMKNNGSGGYAVFQSVTGARGHDAALGDIDGDGDLDAFVTENGNYGNTIFLNNGSGTFTQSGTNFGTEGGEIALGDLDGDTDLDAWVGTGGGTSELWINNGSGVFTAGPVITNGYYCKGLVLTDNDNDGDLDVFMSFYGGNPQVWTNNGNLSFSLCYQGQAGSSSHSIAVGDINGDGRKDMYTSFFSNDDGDYVFLQGNNNSATISYAGSPYSTSVSTAQSVTQTGATGGTYTATPSGLTIDNTTGAITPNTSTPGTYTVTYTVSGCIATVDVEVVAAGTPACSASGNMMVFANYDGGVLNINVDVNIPNLKIGVCTYEPIVINLTGPFAANVTQVIRAGYPNTNNNHCGGILASAINGPVPSNYSIVNIPPVTLNNPNGYNFGIICAYNCNTTTPSGGCNTIDQVVDYFSTQFGGSLYSLTTQYCCWQNSSSYNVSSLSNSCCIGSTPSATIAYTGSPYCKSEVNAQPVSFTGSTGGAYSASPAGLSIDATTGAIIPNSSATGTYTISYTIPGCPTYTTTALLTIVAGTAATISYAANEFCSNATLQNVAQTGSTGGTYSASPSGLSLDATSGAINPATSTAGNYIITYSLTPSGNCGLAAATDTVEISAAITNSYAANICSGGSYTFGSQTLDTAGTYTETFSGSNGCDSIVTLNLSVNTLPAPSLTVSDSLICSSDSSQICVAQGGVVSYLWNTGDTVSCIYVKNAGNYYVTVTDAANCTVQSAQKSIATYPSPSVSISVNGDTLSSFDATAYQWYLNGGLIPGAGDSVFVASVSGSYYVEITDANGCSAASTNVQVTITGIKDFVSNDLKVYPNPIENGKLHFETSAEWLGTELAIFNSTGQSVYRSVIAAQRFDIDLKAEQGVYYLYLRSSNNTVVKRLIHL